MKRCAIYTRKSTEEGLEQDFNSLDAQREACSAFIKSQKHEGWKAIRDSFEDGGFSGGSMDRPGLQRLLDLVREHRVDVIVVYKVDRLTRSLSDFARMVDLFDIHDVSFVSVTQQFNTTTSMGRLTLNVLLSFAQFEREVTAERIRDKIAASKRKGGTLVAMDYVMAATMVAPPDPVLVRGIEIMNRTLAAAGRPLDAGVRLGSWFREAGLPMPYGTDLQGTSIVTHPDLQLAEGVAGFGPQAVRLGVATEEEIAGLPDRIRAVAARGEHCYHSPTVGAAWTRVDG